MFFSVSNVQKIQKMSFYYWDDSFRNKSGLSLRECIEKFGTQVVSCLHGRYKVILLDGTKTLKYSWMLWFKSTTGMNIPVIAYEEQAKRIPGQF